MSVEASTRPGEKFVRVTVTETHGSAPREAGAWMQVWPDEFRGSIGGGNLEYRALELARRMLSDDEDRREETWGLGPSLRQCCGGAVTLSFERSDSPGTAPNDPGRLDLYLFGAGHVGQAVARALEPLPFRVHWLDSRPGVLPDPLPANAVVHPEVEPQTAIEQASPGSLFLVMTHSHELDEDICHAVLNRDDFRWLGLIGSATKRKRFVHRLAERGIALNRLEQLVCPIGAAGPRGKRPATIAVAVAAELLAEHVPAEWK